DLAGGAVGEVLAADDVADALLAVVDDDRELIGEDAVGTLQHEIADLAGDVLVLGAESAIEPVDRGLAAAIDAFDAQPQRSLRPAAQARATRARIDRLDARRVRAGRRRDGEREV